MNSESILIISNDIKIGNLISSKVKLLRNSDIVRVVTYIEAISVLNTTSPSIIIVYSSNKDSVGIVKEIRNLKNLDNVPIILAMENFIEELLLFAFDSGIDDYFFMTDADSVILIRILLTLQKAALYRKSNITKDIFIMSGIIDKYTGIYTRKYAPLVLKNFFSKSIEDNLENAVFMCVKPISKNAKRLNMHNIANIIKKIPRTDDIVTYGKDMTFYIAMYNSGIAGTKSIAERIRRSLNNDCNVFINAAAISTSFEEMEPVLLQSLNDQIANKMEFNYLYNLDVSEAAEAMDILDEHGKEFKVFKKEFFSVFESIAKPVFEQKQTEISEKLPNADVKFNITETESNFSITHNKLKSKLVITYPSYMKLLVDIHHSFSSDSPIIRRLSLDFEDFSEEKLSSFLNDVIREFEIELKKDN